MNDIIRPPRRRANRVRGYISPIAPRMAVTDVDRLVHLVRLVLRMAAVIGR
ncbi:hypothetical protein [Streptomonospora nanhaiensis]|uniref:Uncharacterized protein n=1 Tax=Streptomonospora nanhaiensis TaxID=1323731 RepID=A0A853BTI1_9ACTN|nr:hypothetical protein [Streptomonospora nanhaiensis]MBX9386886.1 hypothetical protein [Streptomonospora nanhaiensis]NYI98046.1 hypothetical protein [Streptomonospora nanhaiensis]